MRQMQRRFTDTRHAIALAICVAAVATAALPRSVAAATKIYSVNVPKLLGSHVASAGAGGALVLLPSVYRSDLPQSKLYASGGRTAHGYALAISAAPHCGDATACFVADFDAVRGGNAGPGKTVTLTGGIVGTFRGLSCGASCSPPSIEWATGGFLYSIQANALGPAQATLVALADSAIKHGPR
jgi:hypothetical protein